MELIKKEIHNFAWKTKNAMQFTIDDTINVPDSLMDMERLVLVKGNIVIEETQSMVDRFQVKGSLNYQILYCGNEKETAFDSMVGKIPFVEYINADNTKPEDYIEVHTSLNDLTVTMLHSRKVSVKALVGMDYQVKANENFQVVTDIEERASDYESKLLDHHISMVSLQKQEKNWIEVKEQVEIPSNKPNIYQVIWKSMSPTMVSIKPADGCLLVSGNLNVFLVYTAEDEGMPIQYFTMEIPFEQRVMADFVNEDMISGSYLCLDQYHIAVMADERGEDRLLDISANFTLEMKLYGSEEMRLIKDIYSNKVALEPDWKEFTVQHLLIRNCAKTKVTDTVELSAPQTILQLCNIEGSVSIDETSRTDYGILVEGVVGTQLTYLNKNNNGALSSATFDIPFSYEIEVNGINNNVTYSIVPYVDRITGVQIDDTSIELKAEVSMDVLAFANETVRAVLDIKEKPLDIERKREMPGMIGYIVKQGDTLWSIAKTYYTTVERIMELNELESDLIGVGDKLVIMKE
ncbi:MAG: SPOCS domain-containing protein [Lachnospiraceae bacterium]